MSNESVELCNCISLQFLTETGSALSQAHVAIEAGTRKSFVANGMGIVSYPKGTFSENGKVFVEYQSGDKHLSWDGKVPTEPGHYKIYLDLWTNDVDGSQ